MKKLIIIGAGLAMAACGNAGSEITGNWKTTVNSMGIEMPGSANIAIESDAIKSGAQATKVAKWERKGDQITAYTENGQGAVFTVVDKDHIKMQEGPVTINLARIK
jgi:hypothetical protein